MNEKVSIITSGYFPVPASKGGAVEALDENLIRCNEDYSKLDLFIFSCYDKKAANISLKYNKSKFYFIKTPMFIKLMDKVTYFIAKNILRKKKHMSYRYIFQRLWYISKVAAYISKNDCGKIVIENHSSLFLCLKKRKNYIKYQDKIYYHLHNEVTNFYGCEKIIASCKVLGVSNYINNTLKKRLGEHDTNKYYVLKNRVDFSDSNLNVDENMVKSFKSKLLICEKDQIVLFTGRLSKEKGFEELIYSFNKMNRENTTLLIVGSYYYNSGMKNVFDDNINDIIKKNKKIIFTGYIDYELMPMIYSISDIVVLPSIWDDPAPLTIIEALSSGKALITTYSGGIPEYANEKVAILIDRDERLCDNLVMQMDLLLSNPKLRETFESAARAETLNWTSKGFYQDFVELLEE